MRTGPAAGEEEAGGEARGPPRARRTGRTGACAARAGEAQGGRGEEEGGRVCGGQSEKENSLGGFETNACNKVRRDGCCDLIQSRPVRERTGSEPDCRVRSAFPPTPGSAPPAPSSIPDDSTGAPQISRPPSPAWIAPTALILPLVLCHFSLSLVLVGDPPPPLQKKLKTLGGRVGGGGWWWCAVQKKRAAAHPPRARACAPPRNTVYAVTQRWLT